MPNAFVHYFHLCPSFEPYFYMTVEDVTLRPLSHSIIIVVKILIFTLFSSQILTHLISFTSLPALSFNHYKLVAFSLQRAAAVVKLMYASFV